VIYPTSEQARLDCLNEVFVFIQSEDMSGLNVHECSQDLESIAPDISLLVVGQIGLHALFKYWIEHFEPA
jgi:hypothetical protein